MSLLKSSSHDSDGGSDADEIDIVEHWRGYTLEDALSDAEELMREKQILLKNRKPRNLKLKKPPTKRQLRACKRRQIKQTQQKLGPSVSPANDPRKCPLRILELAAPTKRHCMETVKRNYHILPAHMMHRLKQYVQDERPIFPIPDALKCFEQKKPKRKKHRKRDCLNAKNTFNKKDMAIFCAIFGYRTSQMLLPCLKIELTLELQKICSVVYCEIENIMTKNKRFRNQKHIQYLIDASEKITLWISSILDDAYFKQLEEDFKDMRTEEVVVWDILDNLIQIVLETCIPWIPDEDSEQESDTENAVSNEDHIRNEIQKIIDGIPEEKNENLSTDTNAGQLDEDNSQKEIKDLFISDGTETTEDPDQEEDNYGIVETESKTNIVIPKQDNDDQTEALPENELTDSDLEEDADKKVKFSTVKLDESRQSGNLINDNSRDHIDKYFPTDLVLRTPSHNLLTNMDETWPDDLDPEPHKLTASVSKSVTSMGNITEWEEPLISLMQHGQLDSRSLAILQESDIEGDEEELKKHSFDPNQVAASNETNQRTSTDKSSVGYQGQNNYGSDQTDTLQTVNTGGDKTDTLRTVNTGGDEADILQTVDTGGDQTDTLQTVNTGGDQRDTLRIVDTVSDQTDTLRTVNTDGDQTYTLQTVDTRGDQTDTLQNVSTGGGQADTLQTVNKYSELQNKIQSNDLDNKTPLELTRMDEKFSNRTGHLFESAQTGKLGADIKYSTEIQTNNLSTKKPQGENSMIGTNNSTFKTNGKRTKSRTVSDNTHEYSSTITRSPNLLTSKNENYTTKLSPKVNDRKKEMSMSDKSYKTFNAKTDISPKSTVESITQKTVRPITNLIIEKNIINFDYRVNIKNAPSWLQSGNVKALCSESCHKEAMQRRQECLRKWCRCLDKEFEGMRVWNCWMKDVCATIVSFKLNHRQDNSCWIKLKYNVDRSIANWERNHLQSQRKLTSIKNKSQDTYLSQSSYQCKCEQISKTEIKTEATYDHKRNIKQTF